MRQIDLNTWPRRPQYELFRHMDRPHLSITVDVDVTPVMEKLKPQGVSAFNSILYAITHAANTVDEFKTRFRGDTVIAHDAIAASVTVPIKDENFVFCEIDYDANWQKFNSNCETAITAAKQQTTLVQNLKPDDDSWIYTSCLPWLKFSALQNPLSGPDDCIPRIVWGKISKNADNTWSVPVAVEVHHALVDGIHLAKFFNYIEETLITL